MKHILILCLMVLFFCVGCGGEEISPIATQNEKYDKTFERIYEPTVMEDMADAKASSHVTKNDIGTVPEDIDYIIVDNYLIGSYENGQWNSVGLNPNQSVNHNQIKSISPPSQVRKIEMSELLNHKFYLYDREQFMGPMVMSNLGYHRGLDNYVGEVLSDAHSSMEDAPNYYVGADLYEYSAFTASHNPLMEYTHKVNGYVEGLDDISSDQMALITQATQRFLAEHGLKNAPVKIQEVVFADLSDNGVEDIIVFADNSCDFPESEIDNYFDQGYGTYTVAFIMRGTEIIPLYLNTLLLTEDNLNRYGYRAYQYSRGCSCGGLYDFNNDKIMEICVKASAIQMCSVSKDNTVDNVLFFVVNTIRDSKYDSLIELREPYLSLFTIPPDYSSPSIIFLDDDQMELCLSLSGQVTVIKGTYTIKNDLLTMISEQNKIYMFQLIESSYDVYSYEELLYLNEDEGNLKKNDVFIFSGKSLI